MSTSLSLPDTGFLFLPDAAENFSACIHYCRASSDNPGQVKSLVTQQEYGEATIRSAFGRRARMTIAGVERGQLNYRPLFQKAVRAAKKFNVPIVSGDVSRFIRSASYHHWTNINAEPTSEELKKLWEMADGVPLVTIEHPSLTESERHSKATKRSGRCGRKPQLAWPLTTEVLTALETQSIREVAALFNISKSTVGRFWDEWKDEPYPMDAYFQAFQRGELSEDGRRKTVPKP